MGERKFSLIWAAGRSADTLLLHGVIREYKQLPSYGEPGGGLPNGKRLFGIPLCRQFSEKQKTSLRQRRCFRYIQLFRHEINFPNWRNFEGFSVRRRTEGSAFLRRQSENHHIQRFRREINFPNRRNFEGFSVRRRTEGSAFLGRQSENHRNSVRFKCLN